MMPGLTALFWGKWSHLWQELSSELRTALVKLFRSSLTTITIQALDNFPLSILHAVSPLKRLKISYTDLLKNDSRLVILPHLETLILLHLFEEPTGIELIVPNLRQLSFTDTQDGHPSNLVQQAINTAAGSLERIQWDYNLNIGMWTSRLNPHLY
jgi:DNA replication protein DnaD